MKIFVTDKYRIATFAVICALIGLSAHYVGGMTDVQTTAEVRKLPIYSVERDDNAIAVTFDCAWGADDIDSILSVLAQNKCSATFFVLGTWAQKYPDAVKKIVDAGHEIGNHSYNHAYYTRLSEQEIIDDIKKCNDAVENVCKTRPKLFRAPSGEYNNTVVNTCNSLNMPYIQWDVDSLDWKGLSAAEMAQRIIPRVKSGSILLFHNDTAHTADGLDAILRALSEKGFSFVKGSDLIFKDNFTIDNTGRQFRNS